MATIPILTMLGMKADKNLYWKQHAEGLSQHLFGASYALRHL